MNYSLPDFLSDVTVMNGSVPDVIEGPVSRGVLWQATADRFLIDVPGVARYLVELGTTIIIDPKSGALDTDIERFFRMAPLAALLNQRGVFAFHAAAVADENGAVLLAGESGVGKSALLAAMLKHGWSLLSDDLAVVSIANQCQPVIYPTFPDIALWPDMQRQLGYNPDELPYSPSKRRNLSLPRQFDASPHMLRGIYWMIDSDSKKCELSKLDGGGACFNVIGDLLYNSRIADVLFDRIKYMFCSASIVKAVPIFQLNLPYKGWELDEVVDMVITNHQEKLDELSI
jgi:hypothetical protein